jgi:predicted membrane chloride channel (bestrophin family)
MQYKFTKQSSLKQSLLKKIVQILIVCLAFSILVFVLDRFNFPSPKENIKKNITNEIIKLK